MDCLFCVYTKFNNCMFFVYLCILHIKYLCAVNQTNGFAKAIFVIMVYGSVL